MIDWTEPYTIDWSVVSVNPDTWDDASVLSGVKDLSIDRDCTDSVPLLETSSMTCDYEAIEDGWYRIIANVTQNGSYERVPIATQQFSVTNDEVDYGSFRITAKGQSVLLPAQETYMRNGAYVPKGADGAYWVWEQLDRCISAPVFILRSGFVLDTYVVYDSSDSVLSACWNVLDAASWCMQITGDGVVYILEKPKEPVWELDVEGLKLLKPSMKRTRGKAGVPNRYIARDGAKEEVAENDDPASPSSYRNVGRWIEVFDDNPSYVEGESLWTYARRKLEELSTLTITYDYTREFYPGIYPFGMIRGHSDDQGFVGDLRVAKQKLTLDKGIEVSETGVETEYLWRA